MLLLVTNFYNYEQDNTILLNEIADTLATQFIAHMYPIEDNKPIIIEWINNDPTGTFEYADGQGALVSFAYNCHSGYVSVRNKCPCCFRSRMGKSDTSCHESETL